MGTVVCYGALHIRVKKEHEQCCEYQALLMRNKEDNKHFKNTCCARGGHGFELPG